MEKPILTTTQVMELKNKIYKVEAEIDEIKYSLLASDNSSSGDTNNFGDSVDYNAQMRIVELVREKAQIEVLLEDFEYAKPNGNEIDFGSVVQYLIVKSSNPKLLGKEPRIMLVQENYANSRPEGYRYVSKNSSIGRAFYGAKPSDTVMFTAENGNEFTAIVTDVDNDLCMQKQKQK